MKRFLIIIVLFSCFILLAGFQRDETVLFSRTTLDEYAGDPGAGNWRFFWTDFDFDGLNDIYIIGENGDAGLYHNENGGDFENVSDWADPAMNGDASYALWGDYDGDGYPDLYLVRSGSNFLYRNIDGTEFVETGREAGIDDPGRGLTARWIDYDEDGSLDLELLNEESSLLFHNEGDGFFVRIFDAAEKEMAVEDSAREEDPMRRARDGEETGEQSQDRNRAPGNEPGNGAGKGGGDPWWDPTASFDPDGRFVNDGWFEVQGYQDISDTTIAGRHIKEKTITGDHLVDDTALGGCVTVEETGAFNGAGDNYFAGRMGIGTTSPGSKLHVTGAGYPESFLYLDTDDISQDAGIRFYENGELKGHLFHDASETAIRSYYHGCDRHQFVLKNNGNVGIGTGSPQDLLHVGEGDGSTIRLGLDPQLVLTRDVANGKVRIQMTGNGYAGNILQLGRDDGTHDIAMMGNVGIGTDSPTEALDVRGTAQVEVLRITGGADLAERFDVSEEMAPGMVVAIDPCNPGKLCISRCAYNHRVAGVVSGANNLAAGVILSEGADSGEGHPVALSGRVWVRCDATDQPIEPGDLLTTSDRPGFAMVVDDHERAQGAILGKAMTGLDRGTGMVLALVTLQ